MEYMQQSRSELPAELGAGLFQSFLFFIDASPKTVETYKRSLKQFARWLAENEIIRPQRQDILAYRDELKASCKPSTVQSYMAVVRLFFRWTAQEGIYPNIADHVKGAKISKDHKKDALTAEQAKRVLCSMDRITPTDLRNYAIMALMLAGGLRTIEVSRARIDDLRTLGGRNVLYLQGKGRDERTDYVRLPAAVDGAIRDYLRTRPSCRPTDPLFISESRNSAGKPLTTRSVSGIAKTALVNAGYNSDRLTAHSLRHTAVTLSLLAGRDITEVQQFARHTNISTTMIYSHSIDKAKIQCEEAIAGELF